MKQSTEREKLEADLIIAREGLTDRQILHLSIVLEMGLSTVRTYLAGSAPKEKTAREILAGVKKLKSKSIAA